MDTKNRSCVCFLPCALSCTQKPKLSTPACRSVAIWAQFNSYLVESYTWRLPGWWAEKEYWHCCRILARRKAGKLDGLWYLKIKRGPIPRRCESWKRCLVCLLMNSKELMVMNPDSYFKFAHAAYFTFYIFNASFFSPNSFFLFSIYLCFLSAAYSFRIRMLFPGSGNASNYSWPSFPHSEVIL